MERKGGKLQAKLHLAIEEELKGLDEDEQFFIVVELKNDLSNLVKKAKWKKKAEEPLYLKRTE